jgi:hypothetical protein
VGEEREKTEGSYVACFRRRIPLLQGAWISVAAMLLRVGAMAAAALLEAMRSRQPVGTREPRARAAGTATHRIDDEPTGMMSRCRGQPRISAAARARAPLCHAVPHQRRR